jgi:hypothetical protein
MRAGRAQGEDFALVSNDPNILVFEPLIDFAFFKRLGRPNFDLAGWL